MSFSEEAPRIKFIPGSAEQRGTNFVLALSGERPFCRPLKHEGGYFLLTAEVDGKHKDNIFVGLQVHSDVPLISKDASGEIQKNGLEG